MKHLLNELQQAKPLCLVCTDEAFKYYEVCIGGRVLMYRQNVLRPDGKRQYFLNNRLASFLGFGDIAYMAICVPKLRYWKRFVSVKTLELHLLHKARGSFIKEDC